MAPCYICLCINYYSDRRWVQNSEFEATVFEPEVFVLVIYGKPVFTIYTNSEVTVNKVFSEYNVNAYRQHKRVVGLHYQLLLPLPGHPHPPVAAIQLCIDGAVFVYHMYNASDLPIALQRFLEDSNNTFFGVNSERDWELFRRSTRYNKDNIVNYYSVGTLAALHFGQPEFSTANLTQLAQAILGEQQLRVRVDEQEFSMRQVNPDWDRHTLTDGQVLCAGVSAYLSCQMGKTLLPQLARTF